MNIHKRLYPDPKSLIGSFRRFGETGPAYEILAVNESLGRGKDDVTLIIKVLEFGEVTDYGVRDALEDPTA